MRIDVEVRTERTTSSMQAQVRVSIEGGDRYSGRDPMVGALEKALAEGRKTAVGTLEAKEPVA